MKGQLGGDAQILLNTLGEESPVSVLLNPAKSLVDPGYLNSTETVPWNSDGRYLRSRPGFTMDPFFHAGCYYVMEASSMAVGHFVRQSFSERPVRALDLCAAPGGKSVVLSNALHSDSLIVGNEIIGSRFAVLQFNLDKWGTANTIRVSADPARLPWTSAFDLVVVDAPCSGEGLFRKDHASRRAWTPQHVVHCAARQRRILHEAVRLLAPGGMLLYSTCTYAPEENIAQVRWLIEHVGLMPADIDIPSAWEVERITDGDATGYQWYPHRVRGEGFFASALYSPVADTRQSTKQMGKGREDKRRKPLPKTSAHAMKFVQQWTSFDTGAVQVFERAGHVFCCVSAFNASAFTDVRTVHPGTEIGRISGDVVIPSHALALSRHVQADIPRIELTLPEAVTYLRRGLPDIAPVDEGWHLACYQGHPIGWLKQTKAGLKNVLPVKLRIMK